MALIKTALNTALSILMISTLSACGGGGGNSSSAAPVIPVTPAASAPLTITGSPIVTTKEDDPYSFQVTVNNASGTVRYEIENAPDWLTISNSGSVSGTPRTDADTGVFENITISATDDRQETISLSPFNLDVIAVNDPPVITIDQSSLNLDARETFNINYSVTDEEGADFTIDLSGIVDDLNATISEAAITGTAKDVDEVRSGSLGVSISSDGETYDYSIDMNIFPLNDSGNGRTIFGSKKDAGVTFVILGDGYTAEQEDLYHDDANDFIREMHLDSGIISHMSAWNIHTVYTPSNQSGSDDTFGEDTVDTYFGTGYNCADIPRLICANSSIVWLTAIEEYPDVNQVIVIVNDARYGGSGGSFSIYSRSAPSVALHEMGHSFADLRDEYVDENIAFRANSFVEGREANVTKSIDPNVVPWSHWIEDKTDYPTREFEAPNKVGIIEGAYYNASGFYRPLGDSRMRSNNAFFGVVSSEAWIEQIYATAGPVSGVTPVSINVEHSANEDVEFEIQPLFDASIQKITWKIDGAIQDSFTNSSKLLLNSGAGTYDVEVSVEDVTGKVRKPNAISNYSRSWNVTLN